VFRVFNQYISLKSVILFLLEGALITLAVLSATRLRFWGNAAEFRYYVTLPEFGIQALVFVAAFQVCFFYCELYDWSELRRWNDFAVAVGQSLGAACLLLGMVYFIFPTLLLGRGIFFISLVLVPAFVTSSRVALDRVWRAAGPRENVLILGAGPLAETVARELSKRNDLNVRVTGFIDLGNPADRASTEVSPILGSGDDLQSVVTRRQVSRIVVALEDRRKVLPIRDLVRLKVHGVRVEDANSTISALTGKVWLETVKPSWFVFSDGFRRSTITQILKRAVDLTAGICGLVVSLPVMAMVAAAIRLDTKGPVIYRQTRVGLGGKCFSLLKFRSMRTDAEANGARWAVEHDPRVTRVGRFLRKYRLDELPQWLNVIRGEMSLVGPRPERPEFVDELRKHISYYDERHSVRPGLTGWAQVQYEYGSSVEDAMRKLEYDLFYLQNMSTFFDCAILLSTVRIVLTGRGSK
jgi:sugar transferase (PEP-CTERM system associated)